MIALRDDCILVEDVKGICLPHPVDQRWTLEFGAMPPTRWTRGPEAGGRGGAALARAGAGGL